MSSIALQISPGAPGLIIKKVSKEEGEKDISAILSSQKGMLLSYYKAYEYDDTFGPP